MVKGADAEQGRERARVDAHSELRAPAVCCAEERTAGRERDEKGPLVGDTAQARLHGACFGKGLAARTDHATEEGIY
jgi:hypothetical protein